MKNTSCIFIIFVMSILAKGQVNPLNKYSLNCITKAFIYGRDSNQLGDYLVYLDFKVNGKSDSLINQALKKFYYYSKFNFIFGRKPGRILTPEMSFPFFSIGLNTFPIKHLFKDTILSINEGKNINISNKILEISGSSHMTPDIDSIYWQVKNDVLVIKIIAPEYTYDSPNLVCSRRQLLIDLKNNKILDYKELFNDSTLVLEKTLKQIKKFEWTIDGTSKLDKEFILAEGEFNAKKNFIIDKVNQTIRFNLVFINEEFYDKSLLETHIQTRFLEFDYATLGISKQTVRKIYHPFFF